MDNLTELTIKQAKPKEKQYKLTDGGHVFKDLPEWLKILAIKIPFWREAENLVFWSMAQSNSPEHI